MILYSFLLGSHWILEGVTAWILRLIEPRGVCDSYRMQWPGVNQS